MKPGRSWIFGDDVDTDQLAPGAFMKSSLEELASHCLERLNPDFAKQVQSGDIVVAGRNFGAGSSREQAVQSLLQLGVTTVIAESFASYGAQIHICDADNAALADVKASQPEWGRSHCDIAYEKQVARLFEEATTEMGGLDVLVNNAGIAGPTGAIEDIESSKWRDTVDVNLNGQFYCTKYAMPLLKRSQNASIICISSVAGRLGYGYRTPYSATKWAIIGLVKSLAIELGPSGIRANALLPGIVEGPRMQKVIADRAAALELSYQDMEQDYLNKISLRRMVSAQDVAEQAIFLASPLGRNISGQAISICGNVETL